MRKSFYFIRHGETDWNKSGLYQGSNDIPLNATGISQARKLAESLSFEGFTEIFTSPLLRAKQTAQILSSSLPLIEVPDLMECKSEQSARYMLGLKSVHPMPSFEKALEINESPEDFISRVKKGSLSLGENIFMIYREAKSGEVIFGKNIVKKILMRFICGIYRY